MRSSRRPDDPIGLSRAPAAAYNGGMSATPAPAPTPPPDPCAPIIAIVTRPTVTTSVCTVRPNHVLVENGWVNTVTTGPGGGNTAVYPQTFIRIGTSLKRVELAFTPPTWNTSSTGGAVTSGVSDIAFGAKYEGGYSNRAAWGVNAQISAPTGDRAFSAGGAQYTGNFNWSYTVSPVFGLAGTFGYNSLTGVGANGRLERFSSFVPSVVLTGTLPAASELFAEYVYFSHAGAGLGSKSLIDAGYVRDFGQHVQIDVEYGISPTTIDGQRQKYFGAGFSFMT